ncbi:type IV secretion protein Rhs [Actinosynnema pretiosum subsp. pretiosum]|uniref:Type IV secretion protein Rhs n=1 Tax=Actinosynnema pretiosum subsp. pretiosum TaxID=103721 RepID=A0AA45R560_9PSEU|nr:hypothetical protein APASM_3168 [Actinosynnema pretiosum subsp. pretiosum]QUF05328.1 type IV secretion protein Rhs [Actinosynnema pretiosum subsp. pretiosum]
MRFARSVRPALRRTALAVSALLLVTTAQVVAPTSADAAANGPSIPQPAVDPVPTTPQVPGPRPADQATTKALAGNQPTNPGKALPGASNTQATSLSPSASWGVSGHTGAFTWSYPLRVPPVPGGLEPQLALSYSSSAIDGRTSSTNNQASWVGDGWDLVPGFVETTYGSCADDKVNSGRKTGDLCWRSENATASYNGSGGALVRDDATGQWRPKNDDGSRVEKVAGAGNGTRDDTYWKITTVDGTQYFFGSQHDSSATWTAPVLDTTAGGPCYGEKAVASDCVRVWRWNLDKVVDRHGNLLRYYYNTETASYGFNLKDTPVSYTRGGTLDHIDYGLREGAEGQPSARVVFTTADRCVPGSSCDSAHPENWPDVPWDSTCAAAPCKDKYSPSFFTTKRLHTVRTEVVRGGALDGVDSWELEHQFPDPGDGGKAALWLKGVKHTGLVGDDVELPQVTFEGRAMPNRVKVPADDGFAPLLRYRVTGVVSETGGVVDVVYADADCAAGSSMPDEAHPENNTRRCYPVTWVPASGFEPRTDYFHKHVVQKVTQLDRYGSSPGDVTTYDYLDGAAWHHDTSEFTPEPKRTWNEFRGFGRVQVRKGDGKDSPTTLSEQRFHRGMNGDKLPDGGTRSVSVSDSEGESRVDEDWLTGYPYEQVRFNGADLVAKTLSWPAWRGPTATRGAYKAYWVGTATSKSYTVLDGGRAPRVGQTDNTFDEHGLPTQVSSVADLAAPTDARCTTTEYARNTGSWLLALPSRVRTVGVACGATPDMPADAISDVRTHYDDLGHGEAPTKGDITKTEQLDQHPASGPVHVTTSTAKYDGYGRPQRVTDVLGRATTTTYAPADGPVTSVTTTDPAGLSGTTVFDPAWGLPVKAVDANDRVTESAYDGLGRLSRAWSPNRPRANNPTSPSTAYAYRIDREKPPAVTTTAIGPNGNPVQSVALYDGLLRLRQGQQPAWKGGRLLTDTRYDSHGRAWKSTQPFYDSSPVDTTLRVAADDDVPAITTTEYDGAGRAVKSVFRKYGDEQWHTSTAYGGDRVYSTPPAGGTATTVVSDAYGRTAELWQHKGKLPEGEHDTTKYTHTKTGQLAALTDPAGNTWTWTYDLRGRRIGSTDPDRGTASSTYDAAGQLLSSTNSLGQKLVYGYDVLGRPTTLHQGSAEGPLRAKWEYDTAYKGRGQLASSTSYDDGNAYTRRISNYNALYQPGAIDVVVPAAEGKLAGTYTTVFGYNPDGSLAAESVPKAGNLDVETVMHTYDDFGRPLATSGRDGSATVELASLTDYTRYGELADVQLGKTAGQRVWLSRYYEDGTRRLKSSVVDAETPNAVQSKLDYAYDQAGNITGVTDAPTGAAADAQCYRYDHLQRLTEAWTPASGACDAEPAKAALGGPEPYWHSYRYDTTGNRTSEVRHGVGAALDTTRNYSYASPGQAQPHALLGVTTTVGATTTADTFTYDAAGNTRTRAVAGESAAHELAWDEQGRLKSDKAGPSTTSFVYTAEGGRLLREDPKAVTLYLGTQEVRLDRATNALSTTRYYSHAGGVVAQRTSPGITGLKWLAGDHNGTAQMAISPATMQVSKRRALPFGAPRNAEPQWVDDRGFVGGTKDESTGLTHLGAREYDPLTGRFVSVDPLLDPGDPQQLNGYAYANNSPVTFSDPSGLIRNCGPDNIGCGGIPGDPPPSQEAVDDWNQVHNPGWWPSTYDGGGGASTSTTLTVISSECGPVTKQFVNPNNNVNLSGYLLTMTTMRYTGILHTPDCRSVVHGPCLGSETNTIVSWEETVSVTSTGYQCGEHDQTPGCGPFVSNGPMSTGEALAGLGKLVFDPTACVGSGASVGKCVFQVGMVLPLGKIAKGAEIAAQGIVKSAAEVTGSFLAAGGSVRYSATATAIGDDANTALNFLRSRGAQGHDVIIHGTPDGDFIVNGLVTHPQQIADAVKGNPFYSGGPINLVSCHGACGHGQELSKILGVKVNSSVHRVDLDPKTGVLREFP